MGSDPWGFRSLSVILGINSLVHEFVPVLSYHDIATAEQPRHRFPRGLDVRFASADWGKLGSRACSLRTCTQTAELNVPSGSNRVTPARAAVGPWQ